MESGWLYSTYVIDSMGITAIAHVPIDFIVYVDSLPLNRTARRVTRLGAIDPIRDAPSFLSAERDSVVDKILSRKLQKHALGMINSDSS